MEVPTITEIVKDPLDLELIKDRVSSENYYTSLEMFCADFRPDVPQLPIVQF